MVLAGKDFLWITIILFLCGIGDDELISKAMSNFYKEELGIKCVIEEPWVTFAESSEFIISLVRMNRKERC